MKCKATVVSNGLEAIYAANANSYVHVISCMHDNNF